MLREHLQVPGIGRTDGEPVPRQAGDARRGARAGGIPVPEFTAVFNDQAVDDWAARVPPPWVLKPRSSAAAIGIKKIADARRTVACARRGAATSGPTCVLEQFVRGDVYHVDSIVWNGTVVFAVAFRYGRPPMEIAHQGGLFITRRLPDDSPEGAALLAIESPAAGRPRARSAACRIPSSSAAGRHGSRDPVFLETSARVGGAFIVDTIEAATGINLWHEWAKIEIAGESATTPSRRAATSYAGIVLSLARQEKPDMSAYTDRRDRDAAQEVASRRADRRVAGPRAHRRADRRLHAALLPRLLRDRAAARAPGRMT